MFPRNIVVGVVALILIGIGAYFLVSRDGGEARDGEQVEREVYTNEARGYSFEIPEGMSHLAYADESVSVGTTTEGGIDSAVDVRIYSAGEDVGFASYDAFVENAFQNACAADAPSETIFCESIAERTPFTTSHGISGEIVVLSRVHENLETGERTTDSFGPHYVFDISESGTAAYEILTVSAPASLPSSDVNYRALHIVADSMQIAGVAGQATTTPAATGTPVEVEVTPTY